MPKRDKCLVAKYIVIFDGSPQDFLNHFNYYFYFQILNATVTTHLVFHPKSVTRTNVTHINP